MPGSGYAQQPRSRPSGNTKFSNTETPEQKLRATAIRSLSLAQARRLALSAQGFSGRAPSTQPGWRTLRRELQRMSVLQIDAINTVIRSHYMPLYSRAGHYDRALLDAKVFDSRAQRSGKRSFYEYWGHECSILPIHLYPLFQWRRQDAAQGKGIYRQMAELAQKKSKWVKRLKEQVIEQGPVSCADLESDPRGPGMWEWSSTKTALEYLFWTGELAGAGRRGFKRLYAAPETVIPDDLLASQWRARLTDQMALLEIAAKALGVATEVDLRDYFRLSALDSKQALGALLQQNRLVPVQVENWRQPAYVVPGTVIPRRIQARTLLTPFDPVVWCRERTERLFDFRYRIEIYVPAAKRVFGYWVMPFLMGDRLVARVDLKADRDAGQLLVKGAWSEKNVNSKTVAAALCETLSDLAEWLQLNGVAVHRNGDLSNELSELNSA